MSERLTQCPKCNTTDIDVLKVHNPDTRDMNCDATLQCAKPMCEHIWQGRIGSKYHEYERRMGWSI